MLDQIEIWGVWRPNGFLRLFVMSPKWSLGILLIHLFIYFAMESCVFPFEVAVIGRFDNHAGNRTTAKSVTLEASALRSIITVGEKKRLNPQLRQALTSD